MKGKCFLICMLLWGMSCVKAQTSDVDKMFPNVVLTRENYDKVKQHWRRLIIPLFR